MTVADVFSFYFQTSIRSYRSYSFLHCTESCIIYEGKRKRVYWSSLFFFFAFDIWVTYTRAWQTRVCGSYPIGFVLENLRVYLEQIPAVRVIERQ